MASTEVYIYVKGVSELNIYVTQTMNGVHKLFSNKYRRSDHGFPINRHPYTLVFKLHERTQKRHGFSSCLVKNCVSVQGLRLSHWYQTGTISHNRCYWREQICYRLIWYFNMMVADALVLNGHQAISSHPLTESINYICSRSRSKREMANEETR